MITPLLVGIILAIAVAVFAHVVGFDRDRAFYATVLCVVASYYGLFAILGHSLSALAAESAAMGVFLLLAVLGFRFSPWLLALGLVGHGLFDVVHGHLIANPGLPAWWPTFCASYDVIAGLGLGWLHWHRTQRAGGSAA